VSLLLLARRDVVPSEHASSVVVNSVCVWQGIRVGHDSFTFIDARAYVCARIHRSAELSCAHQHCVIGVLPLTPSSLLATRPPALLPRRLSHTPSLNSTPRDTHQRAHTCPASCWCVRSQLSVYPSTHLRAPSTVAGRAQPGAERHDQHPQVRDSPCPPRALLPIVLIICVWCMCACVCAAICLRGTHACPRLHRCVEPTCARALSV
jgi:hypothetical protein